ncbi:MAG: hypothetical protein KGJ02_06985 [Verrucomicrobiota bacterium]|nr:hypothetical protein [Verrucomicrobiota bacterium]
MKSNEPPVEKNIYADKSSLILDWLLRLGIDKETFSLREVVEETGVSLGLVQKVFSALVSNGILQTEGVRTAKKFSLQKPTLLLQNWLDHYSIVKKCKMWTYRSSFRDKEELLVALKKSKLSSKVALALHSASEAYGHKNTNLNTLELYLLDPTAKSKLEKVLPLKHTPKKSKVLK